MKKILKSIGYKWAVTYNELTDKYQIYNTMLYSPGSQPNGLPHTDPQGVRFWVENDQLVCVESKSLKKAYNTYLRKMEVNSILEVFSKLDPSDITIEKFVE